MFTKWKNGTWVPEKAEVLEMLTEVAALGAFELVESEESKGDYLIPYMMNDAVEFYLVLEKAHVIGETKGTFPEGTGLSLAEDGRKGILLRTPDGQALTIWYTSLYAVTRFYPYHRILHCWRKGEENLRQLVYMLGTVRDKRIYLGEAAVNREESRLMQLVSFAPLRFYSPVKEDLADRYPEEEAAVEEMEAFLLRHHSPLTSKVRLYRKNRWMRRFLRKGLIRALAEDPDFYTDLLREIEEASAVYPKRVYQTETAREMELVRRETEACLHRRGFTGSYPLYEGEGGSLRVFEEHLFTRKELDYEDFAFHLNFLFCRAGKVLALTGAEKEEKANRFLETIRREKK